MIRNVSLVVILNSIGLFNLVAMQPAPVKHAKQVCPKSGLVLQDDRNIEGQDSEGNTVLHRAALSGNNRVFLSGKFREINVLLDRKPNITSAKKISARNINAQNKFGRTPLHEAVGLEGVDLVNTLLNKNPDLKIKDIKGETAFYWAYVMAVLGKDNNKRVLDVFLPHITSEDWSDVINTLLRDVRVTASNKKKIFKDLGKRVDFKELGQHVHINGQDSRGNTLLHLAVLTESKEMVEAVLSLKPTIDTQNSYGDTPLLLACKLREKVLIGSPEYAALDSIIACLLLNKAGFNIQNNDGKHYLMYADQDRDRRNSLIPFRDTLTFGYAQAIINSQGAK